MALSIPSPHLKMISIKTTTKNQFSDQIKLKTPRQNTSTTQVFAFNEAFGCQH